VGFPRATQPIETALTLRLIFRLPFRQTEGVLTSLFKMMGIGLSAPPARGANKSTIGDRLRARRLQPQETEALIACNILNRMTELG
jgi:hypothetical protein